MTDAMKHPFLSLILCCRNSGHLLVEAVRSVVSQEEQDFELILVDAASTDGSLAGLSDQAKARCRIISEPDKGVYDGMNKGVRLARGEWVYFLGADDCLADRLVLRDVKAVLKGVSSELVVCRSRYADGRLYGGAMKWTIARNFLHHQATFYRRSAFERHGLFDERLRIQADYDFNLRLAVAGEHSEHSDRLVAVCGCGGLSDGGAWANYREEIHIRHRYFPAWKCWLWDLGSIVRYWRKRLLMKLRKRPE